jgi:hypothetical protein
MFEENGRKFSDCIFVSSVADPGCLSEIPNTNFSIPYPGSKKFRIRIRIKEFNYFLRKKLFPSFRKYDPGCSSRIRIQTFYPSRIQESKRHRIPDRVRNTALYLSIFRPQVERVNLWQVLKKFSNDIDLNQEVRSQSFNRNVPNHSPKIAYQQICNEKSAIRKFANPWCPSPQLESPQICKEKGSVSDPDPHWFAS